jgi:hypothetical protein
MAKRTWLRKAQVAQRYSASTRSVDRWSRAGLLPPPEFPMGPGRPFWDQEKLDASDRAAITAHLKTERRKLRTQEQQASA